MLEPTMGISMGFSIIIWTYHGTLHVELNWRGVEVKLELSGN